MNMCKIVLASKSPRRKELMKIICDSFLIMPDNSSEDADESLMPGDYVMKLATDKCLNVSKNYPDDYIVIGADTVVVKDNQIIGKPSSEEDACRMLKMLSGSVHFVYTGVCVSMKSISKTISFFEKTDVYFNEISNSEILNYVKTGEPMDKAGAYGIQEKGALFVRETVGDYNNVVGLPVAKLYKILKNEFDFKIRF